MALNNDKLFVTDVLKKTLLSVFFYACFLPTLNAYELHKDVVSRCAHSTNGIEASVNEVIDGDTFSLTDGRIVKIQGIEAPELNFHEPSYSENGAVEAVNFLKKILSPAESVTLYLDHKKQDRYGHLLAYVFRNKDKLDVAAHILQNGWSRQVIYPPNQTSWQCYQSLEGVAQKQHSGVWKYLRYWPRITQFVGKQDAGYLRLKGEITALEYHRRYLWLVLDDKIWLGIKQDDTKYFDGDVSLQFLHKQVDIRGWLYFSHGKLRIRIRHPQQIRLILTE